MRLHDNMNVVKDQAFKPEIPGRPLTGTISLAQGRQRSDGSGFPRGDEMKQRNSKCGVVLCSSWDERDVRPGSSWKEMQDQGSAP